MAQSQRLEARQSQTLVMSQQLQQSLKLLQLSNLELAEYVAQELESNPLLQESDAEEREQQDAESPNSDEAQPEETESDITPDSFDSASSATLQETGESAVDMSYENMWESSSAEAPGATASDMFQSEGLNVQHLSTRNSEDDGSFSQQNFSQEVTLKDYLYDQMMSDVDDPKDRLIAQQLIDLIDESGYLTSDVTPVSESLACEPDDVERVRKMLMRMDPPGVFARTLQECLAAQLEAKSRLDPVMQGVLAHLDLVAVRDFEAMRKKTGIAMEDIIECLEEIKQLNPKPGNQFSGEPTQVIQPDVFVKRMQNGEWSVELNQEVLPRLLVNRTYFSKVKTSVKEATERKYVMDQLNHANWLIRSLNQRAETMLKVSTELVVQQQDFFEKGVYFLKPMTLKDIALAVGVHESTVGRVTTNKYMATSKGLLEMKFFFSSGISTSQGAENISSTSVKHHIKTLIENEKHDSVLSDEDLVLLLRQKGVECARRTVAKYREEMQIPASSVRRRMKKQHVG